MSKSNGSWSAMSQRQVLAELNLQNRLEVCNRYINYSEQKVTELKEDKAARLNRSLTGDGMATVRLADICGELQRAMQQLESYKEHGAAIQLDIEKLRQPPRAQVEQRRKDQKLLAELAQDRLEKDRVADALIHKLRRILEERAELSARMLQLAENIDLATVDDSLDTGRFEALLEALPKELAQRSDAWLRWFFGERRRTKSYIVEDDVLVLAENLASPEVYRRGDQIELNEEEALKVLKESPARKPRIVAA